MLFFIRKIIGGQQKLYLFLLSILSILSACEFILLSAYSSSGNTMNVELLMIRSSTAIAAFVLFFLTLLINNYFISHKNEELSIILLTGCIKREIIGYIVIQFAILFLTSDILGIPIGMILTKAINIYYPFQCDYKILFEGYFGFFVCKLIYIFVLNYGKFIRLKMDIVEFITNKTPKIKESMFSSKLIENSKLKSKIINFLVLFISIILMYNATKRIYVSKGIEVIEYFEWFIIGEVIFVNKAIPFIFSILHNKIMLSLPKLIMVMSNILEVFRSLSPIINVTVSVIPIYFVYFFMSPQQNIIKIIFICYFILLTMLLMSFILRFYVYTPLIKVNIATMKALGYNKKSLFSIFGSVVIGLLFLIMVLPVFLYAIVLYKCYLLSITTLMDYMIIVVSYIVIFLVLGIIFYTKYIKTIQEVYDDVKYLNRGL